MYWILVPHVWTIIAATMVAIVAFNVIVGMIWKRLSKKLQGE